MREGWARDGWLLSGGQRDRVIGSIYYTNFKKLIIAWNGRQRVLHRPNCRQPNHQPSGLTGREADHFVAFQSPICVSWCCLLASFHSCSIRRQLYWCSNRLDICWLDRCVKGMYTPTQFWIQLQFSCVCCVIKINNHWFFNGLITVRTVAKYWNISNARLRKRFSIKYEIQSSTTSKMKQNAF